VRLSGGQRQRLAIARAILAWLPRCPCCHRTTSESRSPPISRQSFMQ
jgi:ABC-type methionine transport system ATPase subunit